jgi:hypothetical protein
VGNGNFSNAYEFLTKKRLQANRLWTLILVQAARGAPQTLDNIQVLLGLAHSLEEHVQTGIQIYKTPIKNEATEALQHIYQFYESKEIHYRQIKFSKSIQFYLTHQEKLNSSTNNIYSYLPSEHLVKPGTHKTYSMTTTQNPTSNATITTDTGTATQWVNEIDLTSLTTIIADQLKKDEATLPPVPTTE